MIASMIGTMRLERVEWQAHEFPAGLMAAVMASDLSAVKFMSVSQCHAIDVLRARKGEKGEYEDEGTKLIGASGVWRVVEITLTSWTF